MKFSVGDRIVLRHTREEGKVIALIDMEMVEVEVTGISFPAYISDIDHPYLDWFKDKKFDKKKEKVPEQLPVEKPEERARRLGKGIYISFMPVFKIVAQEEIVDYLKVHILNELPADITFKFETKINANSVFSLVGGLHAFGNLYLHNVAYDDMNEQPRFNWQFADAKNKNMAEEEGVLRIRPAKLFEHISTLQTKNEPSFSYLVMTEFQIKKKHEPKERYEIPFKPNYVDVVTKKNIEPPKYEIDLHIEQLVSNTRGMTNADMIKLQLDTFQRYLHLAIVHRQQSMIVIHGLGKGTLREEVHKILKHTDGVSRYKNEWSGKYGFGATEIWFRY